nr:DUF397 domain-containing protein [Actinomadura pelletieri]
MDLSHADWFKSSQSGDANTACVEIATVLPHIVAVRDSTNPTGPTLLFSSATWKTFIDRLKSSGQ